MDTLRNDVVFALRSLSRAPGLTLAAVVCLALGIGATTTMYSALRAIVLNPVPVRDADRVMRVSELPPNAQAGTDGTSVGTFLEWRSTVRAFEQVAGFYWAELNVTGVAEPERVTGNRVTPSLFAILSGRPLFGRALVAADAEPGRDRVIVLSHALWQRRFGSDPTIVGKKVQIDGLEHEVVGVMPREFVFPPGAELWLPLAFMPAEQADRRSNALSAIAKLRPGFTAAQADAEVRALQQRVAERFPVERKDWTAVAEPIQRFYARNPRPYMVTAMISVTLILLIGCANVANLLLARATGRERELAVRIAMGASQARIVRLLLTESAVLALAGGLAGILVALWGVLLFRNSIPAELVKFNLGWTSIRVDGATLTFALLASLGSSLVFGVLPAWHAARENLQSSLRDQARGSAGSRARNRTRSALVVIEIALALMLVVGAGLMLRSFKSLLDADPGFREENVLSMQIALPYKYDSSEKRAEFYTQLDTRLAALPGVQSAGLVSVLPMSWNDIATRVTDQARATAPEGEQTIVRRRVVSDDYFTTLRIPLRRGRFFDRRDRANAPPTVIVSERFAKQLWPDGDAIGKRVRLLGDSIWREVTGVVADTRHNPNVGAVLQPTIYLPVRQRAPSRMAIVLRTNAAPTGLAAAAQREIAALDPGLAAGDVLALERVVSNSLAPQRTTAGMLGVFGVVALVLACVGVYGVMSYSVARRASELGVRLALGAQRTNLLGLILRHGARLTTIGVALGLGGAWAMSRSMRALMHDAARTDLFTFAFGTLFLAAMAMLACYLPARRAAATDPTLLLRQE